MQASLMLTVAKKEISGRLVNMASDDLQPCQGDGYCEHVWLGQLCNGEDKTNAADDNWDVDLRWNSADSGKGDRD